jgi:hypothetical protein
MRRGGAWNWGRRLWITVVACGLGAAVITTTALGTERQSSATASGQRTLALFGDSPQYRPRNLNFGAHEVVSSMRWSRWGTRLAVGHGLYQVNDCRPNCAEGTITPVPATVYLTGRRSCTRRQLVFAHLKVYFDGHRTGAGANCRRRGPRGPASRGVAARDSDPFHKCRGSRAKLRRNGIFFVGAKHAKCSLAFQVAFQLNRGIDLPKGFTCKERPGHIDSIPVVCSRGIQRVLVVLAG